MVQDDSCIYNLVKDSAEKFWDKRTNQDIDNTEQVERWRFQQVSVLG